MERYISDARFGGFFRGILLFAVLGIVSVSTIDARPVKFLEAFRITWAVDHIKQVAGGNAIQLVLDQSSGSGFASKTRYLFGHVSMKIKLVPGDSAGTVTAFYGDREQRINLWFDPSANFHTYSILWNHYHVVFFVDEFPIRVYKNNEARGIPYPKSQPMGIYSTLWEADDWATRGGLEKIDWSKAPFIASYKDFDIEACSVLNSKICASNPNNWWEGVSYRQLTPLQARQYKWVRLNHMIYDYCTDKTRYPVTPPECLAGI
eukprot:Gb_10644 [translate_table: standard]